jgi:nucleotide sugar dehydrogenase
VVVPFRRLVVVGLGYVGLALALSYARRGLTTVGLDVNREKVEALRRAETELVEDDDGRPLPSILEEELATGRFILTTDPAEAYRGADGVIICVGLPVRDGVTDESPLKAALATLVAHVERGTTVVLRTTVVPGMSRRLVLPAFAEAGLRLGEDVFYAYCPERLAEGRAFLEIRTVPVPLAAEDAESRRRAAELLRVVLEADIHPTERYEEAELSKVLENAQRDVNIAIAQEAARLCEALGIDTYRVLELANTHPRVHMLTPGPGVGGFCIPNAFPYLEAVAEEHGVEMPTFAAARRTNDQVPHLLAEIGLVDAESRGLARPVVAVLGLGMKDGSPDARQSPALSLIAELRRRGAEVRAFDPLVTGVPGQVATLAEAVAGAHIVYALVRQPGIPFEDLAWLKAAAPSALIVDAKGIYRQRREALEAMGLRTWVI